MTEKQLAKRWLEYKSCATQRRAQELADYSKNEEVYKRRHEAVVKKLVDAGASPVDPSLSYRPLVVPPAEQPSFSGFMDWLAADLDKSKERA